ncbi:hypothetical protein [Nonomuraea angiospora]
MSLIDWFRSRQALIDELEEAREQAVTADRQLEHAVADREHFASRLRVEESKHEATQKLLESMEGELIGGVFAPAPPRTTDEELAAAREHARALEELVHRLQVANMAADRR